jgi:8-oxo-dGTP diphosphatase
LSIAAAHTPAHVWCALRPLGDGDAEQLAPLVAAEPIAPDHGLPRPCRVAGLQRWTSRVRADHAAGAAQVLVVVAREAGVAGTVELAVLDDDPGCATLSYWIAARHRRRGYGTAAAQLAIRHAWGPMALVRLLANALEQNVASLAILARLGFRRVGSMRGVPPFRGGEPSLAILHELSADPAEELLRGRPCR